MKQVTTFAASETIAALKFYNAVAKATGDKALKQLTIASLLEMKASNPEQMLDVSISLLGEITISAEIPADMTVKFLNVITKYVEPIVGVATAMFAMLTTLVPVIKNLEADLLSQLKFNGAVGAYHVQVMTGFSGQEISVRHSYIGTADDAMVETAVNAVKLMIDETVQYENYLVLVFADGSTTITKK